MPVIPPLTWDQLLAVAESGDLVVLHGTNRLDLEIEAGTGGPYSHVAMIVRTSPTATPLVWEASPNPMLPDPITHTTHTGAQVADLVSALHYFDNVADIIYFVKLDWTRPAGFDAAVVKVIEEYEQLPFGTIAEMAEHWAEGHFLNRAGPPDEVYCAELIAMTLQKLGLLGDEHVPNYYSPNNFGQAGTKIALLHGRLAMEQPFDVSTLPPATPALATP